MSCTCNNTDNYDPCTACEEQENCACATKDLSFNCLLWTGDTLACSGIPTNTNGADLIVMLDQFICDKFTEAINFFTLINVGTGAEVYRGINFIGNKEIRTILSGDLNLIDVIQNTDTIDLVPGTHRLELDSPTDILSLIINTLAGDTVLSTIDLSEYNYDTFVQSASFDTGTQILTIVRNNGEPDINVDLSFLDNHVESGVYAANNLALTLTDASVVNIDLTALVNEILVAAAAANLQADVLEVNPASKAFILNKNPSKTVVLGVAGNYNVLDSDSNYVIEIDNGANDVTIDFAAITATSEFFVGFVQKGTGLVTFNNADIVPQDLLNQLYGQGHVASIEVIASTKYLAGTLKAS